MPTLLEYCIDNALEDGDLALRKRGIPRPYLQQCGLCYDPISWSSMEMFATASIIKSY